jgi:shikimate dehydrogenase
MRTIAGVMADTEPYVLAGIMGDPVMHSRSPMIYEHWLAEHGIKGRYILLPIKAEGLHAALRALPALGFKGVNLTIPHKVAALASVDTIEPAAKTMGAINLVVVGPDGKLHGRNTDWIGYSKSIEESHPSWRASAGPSVVIGAGGGARSVLVSLMEAGAREIRLTNRSPGRAEALAAEFGPVIKAVAWDQRHAALDGAAMLINTTSQGMSGMPPLDLTLDALPKTALVSDIVYIPLETPLLAAARQRGNPVVDGLGMLLHQARPAFQAYAGIDPRVTPALRAKVIATMVGGT